MQLEAKQATNHPLQFIAPEIRPEIRSYLIRGVYFLPNLRYEINHKNLSALNYPADMNIWTPISEWHSNPRQTITPMFGLEFLKIMEQEFSWVCSLTATNIR
jgi:hypothetical protein